MAHVPRLKLSPDVIAEISLKYHVDQLHYSKTDGITRVHHVRWGWMPMERLYELQKIHDILPMIERVVEGGYRMKASLWGLSVSVGPISVPVGMYFPIKGLLLSAGSFDAGDTQSGILWLLAVALPFGDLAIAMQIYKELTGIATAVGLTPPQEAVDRAVHNLEFFGSQIGGFFSWLFGQKPILPRP